MICVTIACGSHKRMIAEHQELAANGVQLVELRLDFLRRDPDITRLIPQRPTATIITARRKQDGGLWNDTEEKRLQLLRNAIASEPEFVDLEIDTADKIPPYGKTRRIISHHDLEKTPEDLNALYNEMRGKLPFFIKIAVMPQSTDDMFRFIRFVQEKNKQEKLLGEKSVRLVGICMGEMGKATRILAKKYGMPYTYATFSEERKIAPGMLVYKELLDLYRYEQINQDTEVFSVIGNPIGHSLSPLIHNRSFIEQKINAVYVPLLLDNKDVTGFMEQAAGFGFSGTSVTIPYKVAVIHQLTKMDPAVERIGACNTVVFQDGQRLGYNTDYIAAVACIELSMNGNTNAEVSVVHGKNALVLGAGGAGMALAYGLKKRGANVTICNINGNKAVEVAQKLDIEFIDWKNRSEKHYNILVNCTPIGMFPKVDDMPIDKSALHAGMVVFDAVYNPENTLLLKTARQKGCQTVSGVEMFVGQACLQYKLFTGKKASATYMRQLVKDAINPMQ